VCLIAFATGVGEYVTVLAANRDEYHARPTLQASAWSDAPEIWGGRDLEAGGTWLALSRTGRLAAVTNVRGSTRERGERSRGSLCRDFVTGSTDADAYARRVLEERAHYADFNLLVHDGHSLQYVHRGLDAPVPVAPGVHGLSNAALDVPWPKVVRATGAVRAALEGPPGALVGALFEMLADRHGAADEDLPCTGVPLELERDLAPIFISSAVYGTRASTVIVWRRDGTATFEERSFGPDGVAIGAVRKELVLRAGSTFAEVLPLPSERR
jgi:uncharacterized protein with NRDE domain